MGDAFTSADVNQEGLFHFSTPRLIMTSISEEYVPGLLSSSLTDDKAKKYAPKIVKVDTKPFKLSWRRRRRARTGRLVSAKQTANNSGTEKEKDARTIFVGNVSVDVKPKEIVKFFKKYGRWSPHASGQ